MFKWAGVTRLRNMNWARRLALVGVALPLLGFALGSAGDAGDDTVPGFDRTLTHVGFYVILAGLAALMFALLLALAASAVRARKQLQPRGPALRFFFIPWLLVPLMALTGYATAAGRPMASRRSHHGARDRCTPQSRSLGLSGCGRIWTRSRAWFTWRRQRGVTPFEAADLAGPSELGQLLLQLQDPREEIAVFVHAGEHVLRLEAQRFGVAAVGRPLDLVPAQRRRGRRMLARS